MQTVVELGVRRRERAEHPDAVPVDPGLEQQQPSLQRLGDDSFDELRSGLLRGRLANELDREHRAHAADVSDLRPARLPLEHACADRVAEKLRALDELLLLEHVEHGTRGGECDRVADERSADGAGMRIVHDLGAADDTRQRQPACHRLRNDHEVGLDAEVLHREHSTRAPEPGLHLVRHEQDAVPVADSAQAFHELRGRGQEAALALLRLEHDRRDVYPATPSS